MRSGGGFERHLCEMAKRGRDPGFKMSMEHRVKIQNSNILNALIEHVDGKRDMSATQVTAGIALLRKVLPDLSQTDNTTEVVHRYVARLPEKARSTDEWQKQNPAQTIQ
jgi:hypothetical protein